MTYLHQFSHGLGDCVQFTAVLAHVNATMGSCKHWIERIDQGKRKAVRHLVEGTPPPTDARRIEHFWPECRESFVDFPSTKTVKCLRDQFGIWEPDFSLLRYTVQVSEPVRQMVNDHMRGFGRPVVGLHLQGNTSKSNKDIPDTDARKLCEWLFAKGYYPVIMDWDNRTTFIGHCSRLAGIGTDAEYIAAFIQQCKLFICCDSGPQKVAFSTNTPTLAVWLRHSPIHYCDNAPNAFHLIGDNYPYTIHGDMSAGIACLNRFYKFATYPFRDGVLGNAMIEQAERMLGA